jgi:hypothetical protein
MVGMITRIPWRDRLALGIVALVLLGALILLLTWIPSLLEAVLEHPEHRSYALSVDTESSLPGQINLQLQLVDADEVGGVLTLRVSAQRGCETGCPDSEQISLFGLQPGYPKTRGIPESATVSLPAGQAFTRQTIEFPLSGEALLYPFDVHELWLGLRLERTDAAGAVQPRSLTQPSGGLVAAVRADVPRFQMPAPIPVVSLAAESQQLGSDRQSDEYLSIHVLTLQRRRWLRVMAVMLVGLIAMTSAYAAFIRSVPDLALGAGGLVLGVWGIRSILVPGSINYPTVVDMALGLVITFLLATLSVRVLLYLGQKNGIRFGKSPPDAASSSTGDAGQAH